MRAGSNRSRNPRELYEAPASRWIAEFVGDINIFEGQLESREAGRLLIATQRRRHARGDATAPAA